MATELPAGGYEDPANGPTRSQTLGIVVGYGITDRFALNVSIPFVTSIYHGGNPHRRHRTASSWTPDDGQYHGTFQDFRINLGYQALSGTVSIAPFATVVIPSNDYPTLSHAAPGKGLNQLLVGFAAGASLDRIVPRTFAEVYYDYAFVEEVIGINTNRSDFGFQAGYFITPSLGVRFIAAGYYTHGGIPYNSPASSCRPSSTLHHDQIAKSSERQRRGRAGLRAHGQYRGLGLVPSRASTAARGTRSTTASASASAGASLPSRSFEVSSRRSRTRSGRSTDDPHPARRPRSRGGARCSERRRAPAPWMSAPWRRTSPCRLSTAGSSHSPKPRRATRPWWFSSSPRSVPTPTTTTTSSATCRRTSRRRAWPSSASTRARSRPRRRPAPTRASTGTPSTSSRIRKARIAELLDARRTPEAYLFDSSGTLRYRGRIASKISAPDLQSAIEALLEGRPVRPCPDQGLRLRHRAALGAGARRAVDPPPSRWYRAAVLSTGGAV